jgi:uncharacterized RDD family membrane protein YckC
LGAYLIDLFVLNVGVFGVVLLSGGRLAQDEGILNLFITILVWLYFAFQESSAQQATLGKRALKLKVVDMQGKPISFWRATARHFGRIVSILLLLGGVIMIFFTQHKQALHDKLVGTYVLQQS